MLVKQLQEKKKNFLKHVRHLLFFTFVVLQSILSHIFILYPPRYHWLKAIWCYLFFREQQIFFLKKKRNLENIIVKTHTRVLFGITLHLKFALDLKFVC